MSAAAQPGSFIRRKLDIVFTLARGQFGESGTDTVTLSGLRCSAAIVKQGGDTQGELDLLIFGMTPSLMQQLSQLAQTPDGSRGDQVTVLAGDDAAGMAIAYRGAIRDAWVDYDDAPQIAFHVVGMAALPEALKPVPPSSYRGTADVVTIMSNIATLMGRQFENGGVSGITLNNPYFPGTAYEQFERCRAAARIEGTLDDGTLAIWPRGGSRGGAVPLISPATGMVGYPKRTQIGVNLTSLYNPSVVIGGDVQVNTSNVPCRGTWHILTVAHTLEAEVPGGQWFTSLTCSTPGIV